MHRIIDKGKGAEEVAVRVLRVGSSGIKENKGIKERHSSKGNYSLPKPLVFQAKYVTGEESISKQSSRVP